MALDLDTILPNVSHSLDGTGFIFGAGASYEAGYPLMTELTRQVITELKPDERAILQDVLKASGLTYDEKSAAPNIEEIADYVIEHRVNSNDLRCGQLERRLQELILERILAVKSPLLDHHCKFFDALKMRTFGRPRVVWIFTTNYDLLIEIAAARVGVNVENGFSGSTERFFDPLQFKCVTGELAGGRFIPNNQLTVKLIKLHGSISWVRQSSAFFENHPDSLNSSSSRIMVLPRRRKVVESLAAPFDTLFAHANRVLGVECKYLVSCGYSFGDEHINQQLLLPVLKANRCRLFALCENEPPGLASFKALPSFSAGFSGHTLLSGKSTAGGTDLWQFSKLVSLF